MQVLSENFKTLLIRNNNVTMEDFFNNMLFNHLDLERLQDQICHKGSR